MIQKVLKKIKNKKFENSLKKKNTYNYDPKSFKKFENSLSKSENFRS